MKTLAIIQNNIVINTVLVDDSSEGWEPPEGTITVDITGTNVGVGFIYDPETGEFTNPAIDHLTAGGGEATE